MGKRVLVAPSDQEMEKDIHTCMRVWAMTPTELAELGEPYRPPEPPKAQKTFLAG